MAETANRIESLQFNRREIRRFGWVLAVSLLLHLLVWGGYEAAQKFHVWRWIPQLAWLRPVPKPDPQDQMSEQPLQFVTVEQPSAEVPKDAKYYSSNNSLAANPDVSRITDVPKIDGTQTDVVKTETVPKPDYNKLQPAPKPANPEPAQSAQTAQPAPVVEPGNLALAKPQESQPQPQTPPRPRTINEALAQTHRTPGVAMKQDGGVNRRLATSLVSSKATLVGQYDSQFVDAVTTRWYSLLESQQFSLDRSGKVELQFRLNYDGTITDMKEKNNTVGDLLGYVCQKAISDPAPYKRWPDEMRREIGKNYRDITFTFYYY
jgi:hypothetical protein